MARHDENDWIASDRATHGLCGHMRPAGTPGHLGGDAGIGAGGAEGDGEHDGGDHRLEVGALNADRRGETRVGALEVGVEPLGGLREDGQMWLELCVAVDRRAVVLLPVEPQACQVLAVAGHGHGSQGGLVMVEVVHRFLSRVPRGAHAVTLEHGSAAHRLAAESRAPSHLRRRRQCSGAPLGLATVRTDGPIDRRRRAEPPLIP